VETGRKGGGSDGVTDNGKRELGLGIFL